MTVKELAERLARFTLTGTLSAMDVRDQISILDSINSAIYNWYQAAPDRYRAKTISHLIRKPLEFDANMINESMAIGGFSAEEYMLGCSVLIGGETNMNEIISVKGGTATLLNKYRGEDGVVPAIIYFDTITIKDYSITRIINDPRILDTGVRLIRDDDGMLGIGAERRGSNRGVSAGAGIFYGASASREFGTPCRYIEENNSMSLIDEARIMLRVDPLPTTELTVQFDAAIDPRILNLSDLDNATPIPVPDQYITPHILPMSKAQLAETEIWANENTREMVMQKGSDAVMNFKITSEIMPNTATPRNRVRTRRGW